MVETQVCSPEILDVGRILDQDENEWVLGWQNFYRRSKTVKLIDAVTIDFTTQSVRSESFFCDPYKNLCWFLRDTPDNVTSSGRLALEVSHDNVTFFPLTRWTRADNFTGTGDGYDDKVAVQEKISYPYVKAFVQQLNPAAGRGNLIDVWIRFTG